MIYLSACTMYDIINKLIFFAFNDASTGKLDGSAMCI